MIVIIGLRSVINPTENFASTMKCSEKRHGLKPTATIHIACLMPKKISNYDIDDNDKQGYCGDKGTWFCASCFEELIKRHNVRVEKNTILSIENALRRFSNVIISLNNEQYFLKNKDEKITVEHNGVRKSYDSILSMEREQLFYGKVLREIIDDIFVGFVD